MLKLENITAGYVKSSPILKGINLSVAENEVIGIIGQNGAGKSTLAKTIMNMVPYVSGEILFMDRSIVGENTQDIVDLGIGYFFQGGRVFPHLTVEENLIIAEMGLNKNEFKNRRTEIEQYFDLLKNQNNNRLKLQASYLSGGEQHQLALAMVLMRKPKFLILDEPSAGLSPGNVRQLYAILEKIKDEEQIGILLIEQNVKFADRFSNRISLLEEGMLQSNDISFEQIEKSYFNN